MSNDHPYLIAVNQIEQSNPPAPVYRTAIRLLHLAANSAGTITIEREQMLKIVGTDADGTMRRHLIQLANTGIIEYTARQNVMVSFCAWPKQMIAHRSSTRAERSFEGTELITERSSTRAERSTTMTGEAERSLSDHPRALIDHPRALSDQNEASHNGIGWLVGNPDPDTNQPTNGKPPEAPEAPEHSPANDPALEALAFSILVDPAVGVAPKRAKKLAHDFPFQEIRRQVFGWLTEFRDGKVQVGALIKRIEGDWAMCDPKPEIDPVLWGRYRTPDERHAEAEAEAELAEMLEAAHCREQASEPESPLQSPSPDHDDPWAMVVAEVGDQFPDGLIERAQAEAIGLNGESEVWQVTLDPQDAPEFTWMTTKGAIAIRKTLKTILHRAVLVDVILPEQEAA